MMAPATSWPPGRLPVNAGFAERLLEVIDSGRRTAAYKLAVLLALLDLCAQHSDACGRAPRVLHTWDIAEQVASLYWPQVIPYPVPGAPSATVLRQITPPRAAIIATVSSFRSQAQAAEMTSWHLARLRLPVAMRRCWTRSRSSSPGSRSPGCRRPGRPRPCSRSCTSSAGDPGIVLARPAAPSRAPRPGHRAAARRE
jgi:hypothetical protein